MRTLNFIVDKQIIRQDPSCDFSGLIPGSEGYIQAKFAFSPEWKDCAKVAAFYSMLGTEHDPQILEDGKTCMIPAEALKRRKFKIQIIGRGPTIKLTTNKIIINQNGGRG